MSHHVIVGLPDGRTAAADYRLPIVDVMRRINDRIAGSNRWDPEKHRKDLALVADWMDQHPEQACTQEQIAMDTCTAHGPADRFRPDEAKALVAPIEEMNDDIFCKHYNRRHNHDLHGLDSLWPIDGVMSAWRLFHDRLHDLRPHNYDHEHAVRRSQVA